VHEEQRKAFAKMADELDAQINSLTFGGNELQMAIARLTEAVMWIRRAVERAP
jgi:hypothetical protein